MFVRRFVSRVLGLALALGLAFAGGVASAREKAPHLTVLVSLDGFRADYLDRGVTPNLKALADDGARGAMRPSFPSLTYPNHYTLVTGKRPDHSGVVGNEMEDAVIGGPRFKMNGPNANDPRWWNQAKPFWVSVEQQGKRAAAMFWPGSETEIDGVRPAHWIKYDSAFPYDARVDQILAWLDAAAGPPLAFTTLYFDAVDTEGHHYGPDSPELRAALVEVDRQLGRLVEGLKARGRFEATDIIVVADHGMAPLPAAHRVVLDDLVDMAKVRLVTKGAVTSLSAEPGHERTVETAFLSKPLPHMTCWKKAAIPARFHYGRNKRVPAIVCLSETGWYSTTREAKAKPGKWDNVDGGAHGFDPYDPLMRAVFVAHGPSFKPGVTLPLFDNVDVYPLLARITGVKPEKGDGSLKVVGAALR
ncbi:ectonucleotide pyrophosphatase/phosphodiesterase [Caulobacter segnis]|uniref:alkaline phosphatase family protein n=1 Tax=Caulobacter segnis TaxID=88688 RepID=UPI001CBDF090|nr:ectonucleotide pyrophosphatase/phosphodiesterase [Caulobacter segnis]UAL12270.1 ectonucleotide pyrophosphatase/phosphodiesterase [Caulobacter segnis]